MQLPRPVVRAAAIFLISGTSPSKSLPTYSDLTCTEDTKTHESWAFAELAHADQTALNAEKVKQGVWDPPHRARAPRALRSHWIIEADPQPSVDNLAVEARHQSLP